jgi:DNA-binding SARP family transcriptional activator
MSSATLCLLASDPFVIKDGRKMQIPEGSKRLLVFVALKGGRVNRRQAAGTLWPHCADNRAAGNLRTALWRLRGAGIGALYADKSMLYLDPELSVDIAQLLSWAKRLIEGSWDELDLSKPEFNREALDLLPGWYDDWVIFERERLKQRLLHAMEAFVRQLVARGLFADAVEVANTAIAADPLRESAQRVLIEAHLAEGNFVEARRVYAAYNALLAVELGVPPSDELTEIIRDSNARSLRRRKSPITHSYND